MSQNQIIAVVAALVILLAIVWVVARRGGQEATSPPAAGVEVQGDDIIVTLPGTSYMVTYYRAAPFPQHLLTKSHSGRKDEDPPMTQAELRRQATRREHWGGSFKMVRAMKNG